MGECICLTERKGEFISALLLSQMFRSRGVYICPSERIGEYSKTCLKRPLKIEDQSWCSRPIIAQCRSKYCRMLQGEHSAILLTFIKLPFVMKIFVLSIFEWPLKTGFTVSALMRERVSLYQSY